MNRSLPRIAAWLLAVGIALAVAAHFWSTAFPVAAIGSPVTGEQARARMESFLSGIGAKIGDSRHALRFSEANTSRTFIERQYGPARLAEAVGDGVTIWSWEGRWFHPGIHEEYQVACNQRGEISRYAHIIESDRALPTLDETAARQLAEHFLQTSIPLHPFSQLHFLDASTLKETHRTDYAFVWEQPSLKIGDATYRLNVTVQGDEIGSYTEWLKIPGWWMDQYGRDRSVNALCYRLATFAGSALGLGLLASFLIAIWKHDVRWSCAIGWGWLAAVGLVGVCDAINSIPLVLFNYSTTQQWEPFIAASVASASQSILDQILIFWTLILVCDSIYRRGQPGQPSFRHALGSHALRDRRTIRALGVGIALAAFTFAYVCIFYSVGQRLGVWCPVETDFAQTLSGPMPWIDAVKIGLSASFTEEMMFRVGGILLLSRLLKKRWIAVVLSAAAWAFLHSTYPQIPGYTRGIELTLVGIVFGFAMLRYGIVATLVAHYLYDCGLGIVSIYQGESWPNKVASILVLIWPLALFVWGLCQKTPDNVPAAESEVPHHEVTLPPAIQWTWAPRLLGSPAFAWTMAGSIGAVLLVIFLPRPQEKIMALGSLGLSRDEILRAADAALIAHGYSPQGWEHIATVETKSLPAKYLLEHGSLDQIAGLYSTVVPDVYWEVDYFRFLQPERFSVTLDPNGHFLSWSHTILPEAPGASLGAPEALALAERSIESAGIDLSKQDLIREDPLQQQRRRDWLFGFEQRDFKWGDARLRTYVRIKGNEAMELNRVFKLPDDWILAHEKQGWWELISSVAQRVVQIILVAVACIFFGLAVQRRVVPWKPSLLWGLVPAAAGLAAEINRWPQFYAGYLSTTPKGQYIWSQIGGDAVSLAGNYAGYVIFTAMAFGLLRWVWNWTPDQWKAWPAEPAERRRYWCDTLAIVFAGMAAFWLLDLFHDELLGHFWPASTVSIHYWNVEEWMPWPGGITEMIQWSFTGVIRLAVIAGAYRLFLVRRPWAGFFLLFIFMPLEITNWPDSPGEFIAAFCYAEAKVALTAFLVSKFWRFNVPAIFLTYAVLSMVDSILLFVRKGGPYYEWQAVPLIALIIAGMAAAFLGARNWANSSSS